MNPNSPPTPGTSRPARSAGASAVAIGTAIVGGLALVSVGATAAIAATGAIVHQVSSPSGDALQTVDVAGITELTVDASAGEFKLRFADTDQAQLEIAGGSRQNWRMERQGDELVVDAGANWLGGGFCLFGCTFSDEKVVLTLPLDLDGMLDAELSLGAGSLTAEGDFRDLDLDVSAGKIVATGAARSLDASLSAGRADLRLEGVQEASLDISAGKLSAELTGAAPREVDIEVSAGSLDLVVADVPYAVESRTDAGRLDNGLQTNRNSANVIEVSVSAGSVTLRPGTK